MTNLVHFFHRPAYQEFQKTLLQVISLPLGAQGWFHYGKVWPGDSFIKEIDKINSSRKYQGLIWAFDYHELPEKGRAKREFSFAVPIRLMTILAVTLSDDNWKILYKAGLYVSEIIRMDIGSLRDFCGIPFDEARNPYPGLEKGYVHLGPSVKISTNETYSFKALYDGLKDIQSSTTSLGKEPEIKVYPLVRFKSIQGQETDEMGIYDLHVEKRYVLPYVLWQDEKYRSRKILINNLQYVGRLIEGESGEKIREGQRQIDFEIEFSGIRVNIPVAIRAKTPWYNLGLTRIVSLFLLSIVAILAFPFLASYGFSESRTALFTALLVLVLQTIFESFQKK